MRPLPELVAEAQRELGIRRNVYPKWVSAGKLTGQSAADKIARMADIVTTLERLRNLQEVSDELLGRKSVQAELTLAKPEHGEETEPTRATSTGTSSSSSAAS